MPNNDIGVQLSDAAVWTSGVSQKSKCCRRFAVMKSESKTTTLSVAAEGKYFKTFCVSFAVKGLQALENQRSGFFRKGFTSALST